MSTSRITVKKVMTPFPYTIEANSKLDNAKSMMREHSIRHLPVLHNGKLAGILSDRDIHLTEAILARIEDFTDVLVSEAYTPSPYSVDLETNLVEVVKEMEKRGIGSTIVTKKGAVIGIFTTTDACRCLASLLEEDSPDPENSKRAVA